MHADARNLSTAPADLTPPGGPGLAPAEGGLPIAVMTVRSRASHSKSFGESIRSYGRGKGLSIAAFCYEVAGQTRIARSTHLVTTWGHLRSHLGVNRGSINPETVDVLLLWAPVGGGRRG